MYWQLLVIRSRDLSRQLAPHFWLREFWNPVNYIGDFGITKAMTDQITIVKLDNVLLQLLEGLRAMYRDKYSEAVILVRPHGGYRPSSPVNINGKVGGASGSQHRYGKAADIIIRISRDPLQYLDAATAVIMAETWMAKNGIRGGIGMYGAKDVHFHVDVRGYFLAWYDSYSAVGTPYSGLTHTQGGRKTVFKTGQRCAGIVLIQRFLNVKATGYWNNTTQIALVTWQKVSGLTADGKYGQQCNNVARIFNWGAD